MAVRDTSLPSPNLPHHPSSLHPFPSSLPSALPSIYQPTHGTSHEGFFENLEPAQEALPLLSFETSQNTFFPLPLSFSPPPFQLTANPWDHSRVPGGSSGGSAAAVAAGQCAVALGSDTGGSVRLPASFCGIVGLKPSYGRVSRLGLMAYASSLDCVGVLGRSVEDTAIVLQAMAGRDDGDSTCSKEPVADYTAALLPIASLTSKPLTGVRFALVQETMGAGVDADVAQAVRAAAAHYETLGATVEEVSLPFFASGLPAYYILAPSEASSNLSRYDGIRFGPQQQGSDLTSLYSNTRGQGFGKEVKQRDPDGCKVKQRDPDGCKVKQRDPDGCKVKQRDPDGCKVKQWDPDGCKVKQRDPDGCKVKQRDPDGCKVKQWDASPD
ncbi:unnamed protein product [Closterium sp. NIES-53]